MDAEAWTLSSTDAAALGEFERKVLRKIFGPGRLSNDFLIRTNRELYELFNDMDVAKRIYTQLLRRHGHGVRIDEHTLPRRVFDAVVGGHRRRDRARAGKTMLKRL